MVKYCMTTSSRVVTSKKENLVKGDSPQEKELRCMISEIELLDLFSVRTSGFIHLANCFKSQDEKIFKIIKELIFSKCIELYAHKLLRTDDFIDLLRRMIMDDNLEFFSSFINIPKYERAVARVSLCVV